MYGTGKAFFGMSFLFSILFIHIIYIYLVLFQSMSVSLNEKFTVNQHVYTFLSPAMVSYLNIRQERDQLVSGFF